MDPFQFEQLWPNEKRGPYSIRVTVALVDGRPQMVGLEMWGVMPDDIPDLRGQPPSSNVLPLHPVAIDSTARRAPIDKLLRSNVAKQLETAEWIDAELDHWLAQTTPEGEDPPGSIWIRNPELRDSVQATIAALKTPIRGRKGRPVVWGEEHYAEVARVYRKAFEVGKNPTEAVRDHWHVNKTTAAKWVARCRPPERNLLPATKRGRAAVPREDPQK